MVRCFQHSTLTREVMHVRCREDSGGAGARDRTIEIVKQTRRVLATGGMWVKVGVA